VRWLSLVEPAPARLGTVALGWGGASSEKVMKFRVCGWFICYVEKTHRIFLGYDKPKLVNDSAIFGAAQELPRADLHTWAEVHALFKASENRNLLCDWKKNMVLSDDTPFNPLVHHHVSLHFTIIFPSFSLLKWPQPRHGANLPGTLQGRPHGGIDAIRGRCEPWSAGCDRDHGWMYVLPYRLIVYIYIYILEWWCKEWWCK